MGTLCIIIGIVFFIAMTGGGILLVGKLANYQIMGQSLLTFMGIKSTTMSYVYIAVPCAIIGLLLLLSFAMIGINNNRIASLELKVRSLERKSKKRSKADKSADTEE